MANNNSEQQSQATTTEQGGGENQVQQQEVKLAAGAYELENWSINFVGQASPKDEENLCDSEYDDHDLSKDDTDAIWRVNDSHSKALGDLDNSAYYLDNEDDDISKQFRIDKKRIDNQDNVQFDITTITFETMYNSLLSKFEDSFVKTADYIKYFGSENGEEQPTAKIDDFIKKHPPYVAQSFGANSIACIYESSIDSSNSTNFNYKETIEYVDAKDGQIIGFEEDDKNIADEDKIKPSEGNLYDTIFMQANNMNDQYLIFKLLGGYGIKDMHKVFEMQLMES